MINLIVFDLDDTLLDTSALLIPIANTAQFDFAIREPLPLMEYAKENLDYLKSKNYRLVLLTQGNTEVQTQKIHSLKIADFFDRIYIAKTDQKETKAKYFAQILKDFKQMPVNCLSIGNRRSVDIRESKRLGYQTCYFHHGEHRLEAIELDLDAADFTVTHHSELLRVCGL